MREVTRYVARDGVEFNTAKECIIYETTASDHLVSIASELYNSDYTINGYHCGNDFETALNAAKLLDSRFNITTKN